MTTLEITLDATYKSSLDWQKQIDEALKGVESNFKLYWNVDFGLFNRLQQPLTSQTQFQTFRLAIEHFQNVIWAPFGTSSIGACLYSGALDYIDGLALDRFEEWTKERFEQDLGKEDKFLHALYCRDVAIDYLKQLAGQMPFGVDCYINPTLAGKLTPIEKAIFFNPECFGPLQLAGQPANQQAQVAVCLPPVNAYSFTGNRLLDGVVKELQARGISHRFIPEEALITNIAGLDELYVAEITLSAQGKRKLQGFYAAGGTVHLV